MSCSQKVRAVSVCLFHTAFQCFQLVNLVDCLSNWYKFVMNNPSNIKFTNFIDSQRMQLVCIIIDLESDIKF